jgi:uncharacterized repeat protein (TIGR01451 family)
MNNDTFSGDNNTSGNGTGGQDEDDHDPMTITITSIPVIMTGSYDLSITKSVNKTIVYSGDVISYTLHYMNLGDAVSGVVIHEIYPTQFITNFPSSFMIGYLAT